MPRHGRQPRARSRRISIDAGRTRDGGDGNGLDDHDGHRPHRGRAESPRGIPHGQVAFESRRARPRAGSHVSRGIPCIRFNDRAALDRLGTEHEQHTFPGCGSGRPDSGGYPEAETQMGLRRPRRSPVLLASQHRWRTHLRWQLGRHRVLAQRRDGMHSLVLQHRTGV